jgi:HK97 family phage major capsid protein
LTLDKRPLTIEAYSSIFSVVPRPTMASCSAQMTLPGFEYTAKPYVLFYTTKRVGGGVQDFDAIKVMKFAAS